MLSIGVTQNVALAHQRQLEAETKKAHVERVPSVIDRSLANGVGAKALAPLLQYSPRRPAQQVQPTSE